MSSTRRVVQASSTAPVACSSRLMCPLTADGVSASRSAAGAKPRLSATSRKVRSSTMSSDIAAESDGAFMWITHSTR
ncbi:transcriptional regulator, LysR family [Burkholderia thailandensis]|uniref:Transcriptional regulator, LysR family n=1 Tax=Burkholderia thailandensis TaxID=57975 RepID=A0AAW9D1A8_BURTH|nr:transcriptional regulator, LysR family [Burkholderia thailandensis]MDW9255078.1 transcriptional regulator, LysR family [Burkholderia thailandensis]